MLLVNWGVYYIPVDYVPTQKQDPMDDGLWPQTRWVIRSEDQWQQLLRDYPEFVVALPQESDLRLPIGRLEGCLVWRNVTHKFVCECGHPTSVYCAPPHFRSCVMCHRVWRFTETGGAELIPGVKVEPSTIDEIARISRPAKLERE